MSDEEEEAKCPAGIPVWVMTFADLMSLLLCFFILLLSFATMDANKFKKIAGSLKSAFGVQNEIEAAAIPKGTSIIAQEYSPGRPVPTPIEVIMQVTEDNTKETLQFDEEQFDDPSTKDNTESTNEEIQQQIKEQAEELEEQLQDLLSNEIEENMISIENDNGRIVIRIREKGSFDSGRASLKKSFIPILKVIADRLKDLPGKIVIAGHTDNIPIGKSKRNIFQSNWDLSTARAVTVLHKLLKVSKMKQNRFVIEGYADTMPIEDNKTKAGRAKNRRVELVVIQDYGDTSDEVKKEKEPVSSETNTAEEIIKSEGILKTEKVIESEKIIKPESVVKPSL